MKKTFVIDTNVLLTDPSAIKSFRENEVVIPITVLDELDAAKSRPDVVGRNARAVVRLLDGLRAVGSLSQGVELQDVTVRVELNHRNNVPVGLEPDKKDNRIISVAVGLKEEGKRVVLISKDINMRVKCDVLGIAAEDYYTDKVTDTPTSVYSGVQEKDVDSGVIDRLYGMGEIPNEFGGFPNQYFLLKAIDKNQTGIAKVVGENLKAVRAPDNIQGIAPRNLEQRMAAELLLNPKIKLATMIGKAGSGKAQPLYSKVLTPTGWTTMGELSVGDKVLCPDGKHSKVISLHPQGMKEVYRVVFSDGTSTECCQEHLWTVKGAQDRWNNKEWKVKSLKEIAKNVIIHKSKKRNYSIPMVGRLDFDGDDLPMDPYLLGALIGDGGLTAQCSISSADQDIIDLVADVLSNLDMKLSHHDKYDFYLTSKKHNNIGPACMPILRVSVEDGEEHRYQSIHEAVRDGFGKSGVYKACKKDKLYKGYFWKYIKEEKPYSKNKIKNTLIGLGIYGKKADKKFIPDIYKYTSFENRVKLIQGLMDTDGTVEGCETYLSTSSKKLCNDFKELCQSVGAKVTIQIKKNPKYSYKGESRRSKLDNYIVRVSFPPHINPFKLSRKKDSYIPKTKYLPTRFIDKIEYVGERECICIYIDHPKHLYITNDYIVTHNTLLATAAGLHHVLGKGANFNRMLISRPIQPMGKDIGYLPGNIEEKLDPWMQPIYDNLELLLGSDRHMIEMYKDQGLIQVEPLTYIRGRSIPRSLMIIDEAQNLMLEEIKTIITRVGEGTKIILTGDISQLDVPHLDFADNGLTQTVERFKHYDIAGHITLQKCERSELAELGAKIL